MSPTSQTHQKQIVTLQTSYRDLKQKAANLCYSSSPERSEEYLQNRLEMIVNIKRQYEVRMRGWRKAYSKGEMETADYVELMDRGWRKRAKLLAEEVVIERKKSFIADKIRSQLWRYAVFPDAYAAIFTSVFKPLERSAEWESRQNHKHKTWKSGLIEYYDVESLTAPGLLWCPILKRYSASKDCVAAHIVPHSLGYRNAGYVFGDEDEGYSMIWSLQNGFIMTKQLEKAFDRGTFIIVPIETAIDKPQRYKLVLMDERRRNEHVISLGGSEGTAVKWRDLDNAELQFLNDKRPARRYLYYHYITTILRYVHFEKHGWAEKRLTVPNGTLWATPGPYLRRSMLKVLAESIGDCEPSSIMEAGGTFEGQDDKPKKEEAVIAGEALVIREKPELRRPFDVEGEEEWNGLSDS
ncbi:hypothetical protein MMC16_007456 [Acarospora aff. strigata]|nr:hypothetical protein [Acarospora aff. strigata]